MRNRSERAAGKPYSYSSAANILSYTIMYLLKTISNEFKLISIPILHQ